MKKINIKELEKEARKKFECMRKAFEPTYKNFMELLKDKGFGYEDLQFFLLTGVVEFERRAVEICIEKKIFSTNIIKSQCIRYWHMISFLHKRLDEIYKMILTLEEKNAESTADGSKAKKKSE